MRSYLQALHRSAQSQDVPVRGKLCISLHGLRVSRSRTCTGDLIRGTRDGFKVARKLPRNSPQSTDLGSKVAKVQLDRPRDVLLRRFALAHRLGVFLRLALGRFGLFDRLDLFFRSGTRFGPVSSALWPVTGIRDQVADR